MKTELNSPCTVLEDNRRFEKSFCSLFSLRPDPFIVFFMPVRIFYNHNGSLVNNVEG